MSYTEINADLFSMDEKYTLAHCISANFALGAGIAVEFVKRFDMKKKLKIQYPDYLKEWNSNNLKGDCILIDNVFNLITKEKHFNKPTYETLKISLLKMKDIAYQEKIEYIAMPVIGCGLDKLKWEKVREIIKEVFQDMQIEIVVCIQ